MKENPKFTKGSHESEINYKFCKSGTQGVYKIYHDVSGHFYIGKSSDIGRRISHHFGYLNRGVHACYRMQELYNKSNYEDFSFDIIIVEDKKDRDNLELTLLDKYKTSPLLLNTLVTNNPWDGDRDNPELTALRRKRGSESKKGLQVGAKNPFFGRKHTKEALAYLSEVNKGRAHPERHKHVVINGVLYDSVTEASKILEVSQPTISNRVNSDSPLFVNWYEYRGQTDIIDDRLLFDPKTIPYGLYKIGDKFYFSTVDIFNDFGVKRTTAFYRFKSKSFPDWEKLM